MTDCSSIRDAFAERLEGPVEAVDRHLERCPDCAAAWADYRRVFAALPAAPPPPPLPDEFFTRM
ncbi:MAG: hypothetical protein AB1758_28850, partial [Candidatus Eremiobacterota bacterium]